MRVFCAILLCLYHFASAVFQDEAGILDKHVSLIGCPKEVLFHEPAIGQGSICYALTQRNVLAALHCRHGTIMWRHVAYKEASILAFKAMADQILTLSDDDSIQSRSAYTGKLIWEANIAKLSSTTNVAVVFNHAMVFVQSMTQLLALEKGSGLTKWTTSLAAEDLLQSETQLLIDDASLYSAMTIAGKSSFDTMVRSWDLNTRIENQDSYTLCKHCLLMPIIQQGNSTFPFVITKDMRTGAFTLNFLSRKVEHSLWAEAGATEVRSQYLVTNGTLVVLAEYMDLGIVLSAHIFSFKISEGNMLSTCRIPHTRTASVLTLTAHGLSAFAVRAILDDTLSAAAHLEVWATDGNGLLRKEKIEGQAIGDVQLLRIRAETSIESSTGAVAIRAMFSTSTCEFFMWRGGSIDWTRPELIANAKFMMLSPFNIKAAELKSESRAGPMRSLYNRLRRHISSIQLITSGRSNDELSGPNSLPLPDHFGHRQLVVGFSDFGAFAIDTIAQDKLLWLVPFPVSGTTFMKAWKSNFRNAPTVAILVKAKNRYIRYTLDINSGALAEDDSWDQSRVISKTDIMHQGAIGSVLIEVAANMANARVLRAGQKSSNIVWTFDAPSGSRIVGQTLSPIMEQIASVGRVLGDRGVLYKHLQGFIGLVVVNDVEERLTVFLLSSDDGRIIHQANHWHVGTTKEVRCVQSENWFVYHFWVAGEVNAYQMAVVELYEGPRNVRNLENLGPSHALTRTFVFDHEIAAMAVTTTMQGITTREIVVSLRSGEVALVPRRLLDPRRPMTDKLTSADKEEYLQPYDATIVLEPRAVLSHTIEVFGIEKIAVSPTLLESTGLVCTYGLDVFITRVTPSMPFDTLSDSFSKVQIILSLTVMIAAIVVTRPFATYKSLQRKWVD